MGWGDEVMASGHARVVSEQHGGSTVAIMDTKGRVRSHDAWRYNPRIVTSQNAATSYRLLNASNARPYIKMKTDRQWTWKPWDVPVGELFFDRNELDYAAKFSPDIIIEPTIKSRREIVNKLWSATRWEHVLHELLRDYRVAQLGPSGHAFLRDVERIITPNPRAAAAVMARARVVVTHEGGTHHSAAAVGVRAVVLFGGFISPRATGYASHINLFRGNDMGCGMREPCAHCAKALADITPDEVLQAVHDLLT